MLATAVAAGGLLGLVGLILVVYGAIKQQWVALAVGVVLVAFAYGFVR